MSSISKGSLTTSTPRRRSSSRILSTIPVHVNTLRYRLRRFAELTGRSLDATDTLIEASFALTASTGTMKPVPAPDARP
ncbi:helix-turn-helix domain-containing protein [Symbioplanes lichenis]|uniref:helix-turn-helix domain-containing protein n=1 Tax=Symbioplanes lichenis TaxID=1629072 RepID=UPI0034DB6232